MGASASTLDDGRRRVPTSVRARVMKRQKAEESLQYIQCFEAHSAEECQAQGDQCVFSRNLRMCLPKRPITSLTEGLAHMCTYHEAGMSRPMLRALKALAAVLQTPHGQGVSSKAMCQGVQERVMALQTRMDTLARAAGLNNATELDPTGEIFIGVAQALLHGDSAATIARRLMASAAMQGADKAEKGRSSKKANLIALAMLGGAIMVAAYATFPAAGAWVAGKAAKAAVIAGVKKGVEWTAKRPAVQSIVFNKDVSDILRDSIDLSRLIHNSSPLYKMIAGAVGSAVGQAVWEKMRQTWMEADFPTRVTFLRMWQHRNDPKQRALPDIDTTGFRSVSNPTVPSDARARKQGADDKVLAWLATLRTAMPDQAEIPVRLSAVFNMISARSMFLALGFRNMPWTLSSCPTTGASHDMNIACRTVQQPLPLSSQTLLQLQQDALQSRDKWKVLMSQMQSDPFLTIQLADMMTGRAERTVHQISRLESGAWVPTHNTRQFDDGPFGPFPTQWNHTQVSELVEDRLATVFGSTREARDTLYRMTIFLPDTLRQHIFARTMLFRRVVHQLHLARREGVALTLSMGAWRLLLSAPLLLVKPKLITSSWLTSMFPPSAQFHAARAQVRSRFLSSASPLVWGRLVESLPDPALANFVERLNTPESHRLIQHILSRGGVQEYDANMLRSMVPSTARWGAMSIQTSMHSMFEALFAVARLERTHIWEQQLFAFVADLRKFQKALSELRQVDKAWVRLVSITRTTPDMSVEEWEHRTSALLRDMQDKLDTAHVILQSIHAQLKEHPELRQLTSH